MANFHYDIGGNSSPSYEAIAEIPPNRTLIALQLTGEPAIKPEIERLKNIQEVFEHFKPAVNVEFVDEEGATIPQTFRFHSIDDFGIKGLTSQSALLKDLTFKKDNFEKITRLFKTNRALHHAMKNKDSREALLNCLQALRNDLDKTAANK